MSRKQNQASKKPPGFIHGEFHFDEKAHRYTHDGLHVPNVTRVLDRLYDWAGVPSGVLEYASERGKAVHLACEMFDEDDLDYDTLDPVLQPYVDGWIKFREDTKFEITEIEERVFNHRHRYAGTLDRIGVLNGDDWVIDLKTVAKLSPVTGLQTAAYEAAYRTDGRKKPYRRGAVQLKNDGTYRLKEYDDKREFQVFLAELACHNWRELHGE